ncbi:hypothetical protein HC251_14275 [Iamia sp. SCSIO 61187]|uniref:DUF3592 domain-containing protein n=1 Tax=Iamia sp. SCSIO 61187 TaxID=2722752 RepID=UPI001C6363FB|nr:DUF3592 domain-containing protein [Iamia sp. SCSIO 61187]QYG93475.1 hypothetical protein HC251_14275 [Iamia sp. SCSIO 61187]
MARWERTEPWQRWIPVALLGVIGLWAAGSGIGDRVREERLRDEGVEVVAEVVEVETNRTLIGYHDTLVRFDLPDGAEARASVATEARPTSDRLRIRYDPDRPSTAEAVEDPVPVWTEKALLAGSVGVPAGLIAVWPTVTARREARRRRAAASTSS